MAWPDGSKFLIANGVKWGTGPKFYPGPSVDTPWNHVRAYIHLTPVVTTHTSTLHTLAGTCTNVPSRAVAHHRRPLVCC